MHVYIYVKSHLSMSSHFIFYFYFSYLKSNLSMSSLFSFAAYHVAVGMYTSMRTFA
jgi:hypothetical protein